MEGAAHWEWGGVGRHEAGQRTQDHAGNSQHAHMLSHERRHEPEISAGSARTRFREQNGGGQGFTFSKCLVTSRAENVARPRDVYTHLHGLADW